MANFPSSPHFALLIKYSSNCPKTKKFVDCPSSKGLLLHHPNFCFCSFRGGGNLIGNLAA
jgi:hypothetical protein